jgi:hypothetical protein
MLKDLKKNRILGGVSVLLMLIFAAAVWSVYENLDGIIHDAGILEQEWIPWTNNMHRIENLVGFALFNMSGLHVQRESRIDAAQKALKDLQFSLSEAKNAISRQTGMDWFPRRIDEVAERTGVLLPLLDELSALSVEVVNRRAEVEGMIGFLRTEAKDLLAGKRRDFERAIREGEQPYFESRILSLRAVEVMVDSVSNLERALFALSQGESSTGEFGAAAEAHEKMQVDFGNVRSVLFDESSLERINRMFGTSEILRGVLGSYLRLLASLKELSGEYVFSGEALWESVGKLREDFVQESLRLAGTVVDEAIESSKTLSLSVLTMAVYGALLTVLIARMK